MLVDNKGFLTKLSFELDGELVRIIGTHTGNTNYARDARDEVKFKDGTIKFFTRSQLYIMQKEGRIK